MTSVPGHSITYRSAVGPDAGRKVMTLQALPAGNVPFGGEAGRCAMACCFAAVVSGLSWHAGVAARVDLRDKLERWARYINRLAVSAKPPSLTGHGMVREQIKTPHRSLRSASCCAGVQGRWSSSRWIPWLGWRRWSQSRVWQVRLERI